jgi:protein tyrosine/serine phosphatase
MNVKYIKISSGEEFICDLLEENDSTIKINNAISPVGNQNGSIGFIPWPALLKKDSTITLNRSVIVYVEEAADEIVEQYGRMFSPIQTPSKNLIL